MKLGTIRKISGIENFVGEGLCKRVLADMRDMKLVSGYGHKTINDIAFYLLVLFLTESDSDVRRTIKYVHNNSDKILLMKRVLEEPNKIGYLIFRKSDRYFKALSYNTMLVDFVGSQSDFDKLTIVNGSVIRAITNQRDWEKTLKA